MIIQENSSTNKPLSFQQQLILAIICLIIGTAIFGLALFSINSQNALFGLNAPVLDWFIAHRSIECTNILQIITKIASPLFLASSVCLISLIWMIAKHEVQRPLLLVGSMGFMVAVSLLLKNLIHNLRPDQINMIPAFETGYSFPSGHTLAVAVFLFVLGYLIYSRNFSWTRLILWKVTSIILICLTAVSRLYLGYHWLTDVVASLGISLIVLALVIFVDRFIEKRTKKLQNMF